MLEKNSPPEEPKGNVSETEFQKVPRKWHQYPGKNLRFLIDYIRISGLNTTKISIPSGLPPQSLRIQLQRDDMKLSKAKKLIENTGCKLDVILYPQAQEEDDENYIVVIPKKKDTEEKAGNLAFLSNFMKQLGQSQYDLAEKLGITQGAVYAWFATDDIMISYINRIKDAYSAKLEFRITEK